MDSKVRYGQEHGANLIRIAKKLVKNQNLLKLLINTDLDPLNEKTHPDSINGLDILNKQISFVPLTQAKEQNLTSKVVILYDEGNVNGINPDNENLSLLINIYCPFKSWLIAGDTLRPFAIMTEIRKSLQNKTINGLGEIRYLGFELSGLSEEMSSYSLKFEINAFN